MRNSMKYHLLRALRNIVAEESADGDSCLYLDDEARLRLISMSDEELRELAGVTLVYLPEKLEELADRRIRQAIEEHISTRSEWATDLVETAALSKTAKDTSYSILITMGETDLRNELRSALARGGFVVAVVPDYPEALLKLDEFNPDIAIVDEVLPCGDGKDACSQLHNGFSIPVILLGKDSTGEAWQAAVEAGADFYFTKPSNHRELIARVKAILRRYKGELLGGKKAALDSKAAPIIKNLQQSPSSPIRGGYRE